MPRYRRPPASLAEVWCEGPALRLRDLIAITGLSPETIRQDIRAGDLKAAKRTGASPYLVTRPDARAWLGQMGFTPGTRGNPSVIRYHSVDDLVHAILTMGLGRVIRQALTVADKVTGGADGLQTEITHEAWTGMDGYGSPTYATAKTVTALVQRRQVPIRTSAGTTLVSRTQLTILQVLKANGASTRTEPIDLRDRLTLPDGSTGQILDIQGFLDPSTGRPFGHEVYLA